jgi:diguanylate cyclase (GGDEF)-like protein/PAS domain S-box-containing protein
MSGATLGGNKLSRVLLQESELRYRRLFEAAQDGILILDARTGAITDVNPFLINMLGYSREEFLEKRLWEVGAFRDVQASKDAFVALQKSEYIRYKDLPLRAKDGHLIPVEFVSNVYVAGRQKVIQCNIRNISDRKEAQDALVQSEALYREQSIRDHLTGLYNRRYLEGTLERELARVRRKQGSIGVIMMDVDGFKRINDTVGHAAGDAVLRELGNLLQGKFRADDVAARYGGDEFVLILPNMSRELAYQRAELVCEVARQMDVRFEQQPVGPLTLSAGVAAFPENGLTSAAVMKAVDGALYRAKQNGGGWVMVAK